MTTAAARCVRMLPRRWVVLAVSVIVTAQAVRAQLRVKSIQQSNPFASCPGVPPQTNVLSVNFMSQQGVGANSSIEISNLTGAEVQGQTVPISGVGVCPDSAGVPGRNKCFSFLPAAKTWQEAASECIAAGGHLASFEDQQDEMAAIMLTRRHQDMWLQKVWIGLSKDANQEWRWQDGSKSTYTNWQPNQPTLNPSGKTCAVLVTGAWAVADCESAELVGLCEKSLDVPARDFCSNSKPGFGDWNRGKLTLHLCEGASIDPQTLTQFHFEVVNPSHVQPSPDVRIAVSGSLSIQPTPMDKLGPQGVAGGVVGGADPLLILDRCSACPRGSFLDGLRGCSECPPASFSAQVDSASCQPCPSGSNSSAASISADNCSCTRGRWAYNHSRCQFCNSSTTLRDVAGRFSDGSGAEDYVGGTFCTWTVVGQSWKVALEFDYFDVAAGDMVEVLACPDIDCTRPTVLASLTGPLKPGLHARSASVPRPPAAGRSFPFPPRPNPPPPPPATLSVYESTSSILRVMFRAAPPSPPDRERGVRRGGFVARWFTPPPHFTDTALFRFDSSRPCPQQRRQPQAADSTTWWLGLPSLSADDSSTALVVLQFALDSPAPLQSGDTVSVSGLSAVGVPHPNNPRVEVETLNTDDSCTSWAAPGARRAGSGSKCFVVVSTAQSGNPHPLTWEDGERQCREMGGHLASVQSGAEADVVYKMLQDTGTPYAWIGLRYNASSRAFAWADGSRMGFENWFPRDSRAVPQDLYPQNGHCASVWTQPVPDARWHRTQCDATLSAVVCSKDAPRHRPDKVFCAQSKSGGEWNADADGGSLTLRVCEGQRMLPGTVFLVSFNVTYATTASTDVSVNVSASGRINASSSDLGKLQQVDGCYACLPNQVRRFSGRCDAVCAGGRADAPFQAVYCSTCPAGSQALQPASQGSADRCTCSPGFTADGDPSQCVACPPGWLCPGAGAAVRCPGNTTSLPGAYGIYQCMCGPGYTRGDPGTPSADLCMPCPADFYCTGQTAGRPLPCPGGATSNPGAVWVTDCAFCKRVTAVENFSGDVAAGMQSARNESCAWLIRPPKASRVVLAVTSMMVRPLYPASPPDLSGGMYLEVRECVDQACAQWRLLRRLAQNLAPQLQRVEANATTGAMMLVLGHVASPASPPGQLPAGQPFPQQEQGMASFAASWYSEPSLARKTLSQTNPFASCPHNSSLLQSNVIMLHLNIRSALPLLGSDGSSITIAGLKGAVMPSDVPVQVTQLSDTCSGSGSVRLAGSDKCVALFAASAQALSNPDAAAACRQWGGELLCVEDEAENVAAAQVVQPAWSLWIAQPGTPSCSSSYSKWSGGRTVPGSCAALLPTGWWVPQVCSTALGFLCGKAQPPVRRQLDLFCSGGSAGWGAWDASEDDGMLRLSVCAGQALHGYADYLIAFTIWNPSVDQHSPPISMSASGSFEVPLTALDKPAAGQSGAEDTQPLEIVGGDARTVCQFPDDKPHKHDSHRDGGHRKGLSTFVIVLIVFLVLFLVGVAGSRWSPLRRLLTPLADKLDCGLAERWASLGLPQVQLPSWCRLQPSTWYSRFTGKVPPEQEFETLSEIRL